MTSITTITMNRFNHSLASVLDSLVNLVGYVASYVTPVTGAGVSYTQGASWGVRAGREGSSWVLQVGGYELAVDL